MQRRAALAALCLAGCTATTTALEVNVKIEDMVIGNATKVRLVVSPTDGTVFPMTSDAADVRTKVTERNFDYDGDGTVDIVIEFAPDYPLERDNHFRLTPSRLTGPLSVNLRVDVLDVFENRIARLGGASAQKAAATITPGQSTQVPDLVPACIDDCTPTLRRTTTGAAQVSFTGNALDAVAAGNLSGASPRRADLAVGSQHDDRGALHNVGLVNVFFGGASLSTSPDVTILGAEAGGRLGAALAVGDLDGDGADDLVVGAPGAGNTAGAIYVFFGIASWPPSIDLASPPANFGAVAGANPGDRLGEALTLADTDGDGHPEVLAGAPGAAAVYVLSAAALKSMSSVAQAPSLAGAAGSEFGRALAARAGHVAVTATQEGAVYLVDATAIHGTVAGLPRLVGSGGSFGAGLTFADVDGTGKLSLAVAAPDDGTGTVSLFALDGLTAGDTPAASAQRSLRASPPDGKLGAALASWTQPLGDVLLAGAPSSGAGMTFIVGGPTLQVLPALRLEADGQPAAAAVSGDHDGDSFGSQLVLDDFNHDGILDMVVGAAGPKTLYFFQGPLQ